MSAQSPEAPPGAAAPAAPAAPGEREAEVRAVLFYSPTCPHCADVLEIHLPRLLERYGERLRIVAINTATEGGQALYGAVVLHFRLPRERTGVPAMVVGETVLVGSREIPMQLPVLADAALEAAGIDWPRVPLIREALAAEGLLDPPAALAAAEPTAEDPAGSPGAGSPGAGVARAGATERAVEPPPTEAREAGVPGSDAGTGHVPAPVAPVAEAPVAEAPAERPIAETAVAETAVTEAPAAAVPVLETGAAAPQARVPATFVDRFAADPVANTAAVLVLLAMLVVLAAVLGRVVGPGAGGPVPVVVPHWVIAPAAVAGLGVAAYLSFVEVTGAEAVCGPVGDCNVVQQSEFAWLFGVVPVGLLGLAGYAAILVVWLAGSIWDRVRPKARLAVWGMALIGVLMSAYLTFLEPFVIGATCAWCLTSAVLMTLVLLAATAWLDRGVTTGAPGRAAHS